MGVRKLQMDKINALLGPFFPTKAANALTGFLIAVIAWYLGVLVWLFFQKPEPTGAQQVALNTVNKTEALEYNINSLLSAQLFGRYVKQSSKPQQTKLSTLPKASLNLELVGLVASTIEKKSLAIISNKGLQGVYGIGDFIDGTKASITYVLSDRVILNNQGQDETLMLQGEDFASAKSNNFNRAQKDNPPPEPRKNNIGNIQKIRADILKNPQSLLKYITLSQERQGDKIIGYRLGPGKDKTLFDESGLKLGDIATSINNVDLTDPSQMSLIWRNLSDASEISLTVMRNGQTHEINISL